MSRMVVNQSQIDLEHMLMTRRPAGTRSERRFIADWIIPLGVETDAYGNLYKRIGDAPVLWSSHTDTVHKQGGVQTIKRIGDRIELGHRSMSNCLGADCTAGVWIMREMIRAQRPGLYVFHREEEIEGNGSEHFAKHNRHLLDGIKFAIAFDRRSTGSIITHQWNGRTCSEAFAVSFARALDMGHKPDSGGSFTDTANYTDVIGECSNISIGFNSEHTKHESLDLAYLRVLRDAMLSLDVSKLVQERQPGDVDPEDVKDWSDYDASWLDKVSLYDLVKEHPAEVADLLEQYGISADEIREAILDSGGVLKGRRGGWEDWQ